jgi:hypothetical protein
MSAGRSSKHNVRHFRRYSSKEREPDRRSVAGWEAGHRSGGTSMKAAVSTRYGPPDVVHITQVEKPSPKDDEVLIQVLAASVNRLDLFAMRGAPGIRLILRAAHTTTQDPRL